MIYAILDNTTGEAGVVKNVAIGNNPLNDGWIDITNADPRPAAFWTYDGAVFTFGAKPKNIKFQDFVDALTDDEYELYLDVDAYDKKAAKTEKQKAVKVKRNRDKLGRKDSYPESEFIQLAQVFVIEGILTQARFDEIILEVGN